MAAIIAQAKRPPASIKKFLGLNQDTSGDTQLTLGESPDMLNFRITENFKLRKREGYHSLFTSLGVGKTIWTMWSGRIAGSMRFLFSCNGKLWEHNRTTHINTQIGTIADAATIIFGFQGNAYILDGAEFRSWDGTTLAVVAGYRPLIAVATPPAGGGTDLESLNQLTGSKRQWFSANGVATIYQLRETAVTSIDWVKLNGVTLTLTTHYTVNLANGTVTPVTPANWPTGTVNNIEIAWTKGAGDRGSVFRMQYVLPFGPANDTRIFAWGDSVNPNTVRYTGLADGVPSAEYWPALGALAIGSNQSTVTDCVRQQDRMDIFTDMDAWYATSDIMTDALGRSVSVFPTSPLHGAIGNIAPGQAQLLQNQPVTLTQSGVYSWELAGIKDERNATYISKRVQPSLDNVDLSTAITVDWDVRGEYWICIGSKVWVFNYRLGIWYIFDNIPARCFCVLDEILYFGTQNGQIMAFDTDVLNDNGTAIRCHWEMGFYDFESETLLKYITRIWLAMKPEQRSSINISYITNRGASAQIHTAKYSLSTFLHADFGSFSFKTSYNPQPFRFKIKAKKFVFFKLMLDSNNTDETATILSIDLAERFGGESK